jgi:hypothetical protein
MTTLWQAYARSAIADQDLKLKALEGYTENLRAVSLDHWYNLIVKLVYGQHVAEYAGFAICGNLNALIDAYFSNRTVDDIEVKCRIRSLPDYRGGLWPQLSSIPYEELKLNNHVDTDIRRVAETYQLDICTELEPGSISLLHIYVRSVLKHTTIKTLIHQMNNIISERLSDAVVGYMHQYVRDQIKDKKVIMTGIPVAVLYTTLHQVIFGSVNAAVVLPEELRIKAIKFIVEIAMDLITEIGNANNTPTAISIQEKDGEPVLISVNINVPAVDV